MLPKNSKQEIEKNFLNLKKGIEEKHTANKD